MHLVGFQIFESSFLPVALSVIVILTGILWSFERLVKREGLKTLNIPEVVIVRLLEIAEYVISLRMEIASKTAAMLLPDVADKRCHYCGETGNLKCSGCETVRYCNRFCQEKDWKQGHKYLCGNSSLMYSPNTSDESPNKKTRPATELPPPSSTEGELRLPKKILFPYEKFKTFWNFNGLREPPIGLLNNGNSCYANSLLQCLIHTKPLVAFLNESSHRKTCDKKGGCVLCELWLFLRRYYKEPEEEEEEAAPISAKRVLRSIQKTQEWLGMDSQEDVHEFLKYGLDAMQNGLLVPFGGERNVDPLTQETTLIYHIFGGILRSQVQCTTCNHESARYESMLDISPEIEADHIASLEDSLAQFTSTEWMDGDNKYKCEKCNDYVKAGKRFVIHEGPNVLTLALKRFQPGRYGKLNKAVSFPSTLDIAPYMSSEGLSKGQSTKYLLYGVIVHFDNFNSSFFGHYVCFVKGPSGKWYLIDDAFVTEVKEEEVLEQKAYLLFYEREELKSEPAVATPTEEETIEKENKEHVKVEAEGFLSTEKEQDRPTLKPSILTLLEQYKESSDESGSVLKENTKIKNKDEEEEVIQDPVQNGSPVYNKSPLVTKKSAENEPSFYGPDLDPFAENSLVLNPGPGSPKEISENINIDATNDPERKTPGKRARSPVSEREIPDLIPADEPPPTFVRMSSPGPSLVTNNEEEVKPRVSFTLFGKKDPKKKDLTANPGRNQMCTCGSNKKYKKCCGKAKN